MASLQPPQYVESDFQPLWQRVADLLKTKMSRPSFETWISPLTIESIGGSGDEGQVTLLADSVFNKNWILKNYRKDLQEAFEQLMEKPITLEVAVQENSVEEDDLPVSGLNNAAETHRPWTPRTTRSNLNPKYVFETFVVGQHNRFCHAAALAVAETPAQSYNPFFIYGGVGLGKTHLIQAIGHFILAHHRDLTVKYVTAEQFTNDLISALGNKNMNPFRDKYRKIDVLMIDDIQFLEGKERTQEEIFHTFNALHESGKQVILSSDRPPKFLAGLEDRLRSRFEWGLIADIQPADVETRVAILQKKAERERLKVPADVLNYIAEAHPNNIRELEGALNKVAAYAMLTQHSLDLTTVRSILGATVMPANLPLEKILEEVARYYHMTAGDLKSPARAKDLSYARQVAIYMIRSLTEASFPKIGTLLNRKHTTILYAYEKICEEIETHPVLARQLDELTRRIKSGKK